MSQKSSRFLVEGLDNILEPDIDWNLIDWESLQQHLAKSLDQISGMVNEFLKEHKGFGAKIHCFLQHVQTLPNLKDSDFDGVQSYTSISLMIWVKDKEGRKSCVAFWRLDSIATVTRPTAEECDAIGDFINQVMASCDLIVIRKSGKGGEGIFPIGGLFPYELLPNYAAFQK